MHGKLSWSQRGIFRDSSGNPLFELYRKPMSTKWLINPDGGSVKPMVTFTPRMNWLKDKVGVLISNASSGGKDVQLEIRGQDVWKVGTFLYAGGALVMRVRRTDKLAVYVPGIRPQWEAQVAKGLDLSLVS